MRKMNLMMLAALAVCVAACGGKGSGDGSSEKKDAITLKTEVQQLGDFANYASFPDEMKIKLADVQEENSGEEGKEGTVKLILLASCDVHSDVCTDNEFCFECSIADEDHSKIADIKVGDTRYVFFESQSDLDKKDFQTFMKKGITRKECKFSLTSQEWESVLSKGAYIVFKGDMDQKYKAYHEGTTYVSDNGSEDWDSILDRYEEIVDKWLSLVNRAANGDASAASESAEVMEEAQELAERVTNAKSSLSSSQLSRFTNIAQKAANAAQQMQ